MTSASIDKIQGIGYSSTDLIGYSSTDLIGGEKVPIGMAPLLNVSFKETEHLEFISKR